ncbi:MAG: hypothetical protein CM1200mP30_05250 [Pseudomonadota bacterium]|nr:MAG: hypothetical protein CM1200mP30_05250 [Pseudomonadota bacterium]
MHLVWLPLLQYWLEQEWCSKWCSVQECSGLEAAHDLDTIFMDKTGTLTEGCPKVTKLLTMEGFEKELLLLYASSAEQGLNIPWKAILEEAEKYNFESRKYTDLKQNQDLE